MKQPPSKEQHTHAQKITHRDRSGKFKSPPPPRVTDKKLKPAELAQDDGQGYREPGDVFPQT